jgi:hypothetical protein
MSVTKFKVNFNSGGILGLQNVAKSDKKFCTFITEI